VSANNDLLNGVFTIVGGLGLATSAVPPKTVTVIYGKIPKDEKDLESTVLPLIYVTCADRPDRSQWNDTGGAQTAQVTTKLNTYVIEMTIIAASNYDNVTGLPDYLSWRQAIVRAVAGAPSQLQPYLTGALSQVFEVNYDMDPPVDRPAWRDNYDIGCINVSYDVVEPAYGSG
jgi:hypothetical protein